MVTVLISLAVLSPSHSHGARTGSTDRRRPLPSQLPGVDADRLRGTTDQVHAHDAGRRSRLPHQGQSFLLTFHYAASGESIRHIRGKVKEALVVGIFLESTSACPVDEATLLLVPPGECGGMWCGVDTSIPFMPVALLGNVDT